MVLLWAKWMRRERPAKLKSAPECKSNCILEFVFCDVFCGFDQFEM